MSEYILSCCSTADLTKEHFQRINVKYICFHYELDGVEYLDDLGETMPFEEFYRRMASGGETKTSQVNVEEYATFFEGFLKDGYDIVHACLSSGISGAYNSASIARDMMLEKYPDRQVYVVDSLSASSGYGLLMDTMATLRDRGMSASELYEWTEANKRKLNAWFFSTDLTFYIKGGRVSKTAGAIGTVLNICPLLNIDYEGRLTPREKIRTKKKVIRRIVDVMEEYADQGLEYDEKCFISQSGCLPDAMEVARLVEERFPHLDGKVEVNYVGTTIGSHTGPGTVALFFWGREREQ